MQALLSILLSVPPPHSVSSGGEVDPLRSIHCGERNCLGKVWSPAERPRVPLKQEEGLQDPG